METKIRISKKEQETMTLGELVCEIEEFEDDSIVLEFEPTISKKKIQKIYDPIVKANLYVEVVE